MKRTQTHRYRNPWARGIDPQFFETTVKPVEYRGFQIFHRGEHSHELVKDGVCLAMRAGRGGPKGLADALHGEGGEPTWLVERAREIAREHGVKLPRAKRRAA